MKLAHEILLALAYVSQIPDPDSVRARFIESLNELDDAYGFEYSDGPPVGVPEGRVFPIATMRSSFGYAVMAEYPKAGETERSVFRNAFQFLAVLLENRQQERRLQSKYLSLQQELNQEKSMVRTVLNTMPIGVWVTDANGLILMGNVAGEEIWGGVRHVGLDQYGVFKAWWAGTGRPIAAEEWPIARVLATGGTIVGEEIRIESFDGLRKTLLISAAPILDDEGRTVGAVGVNQDITERKQAEETLYESKQLLERVMDAIPARVFWKDRDLTYLGCNTAFASDAGFDDPAELVGKDDYQMGWQAQADLYRSADREVIETGRAKLLFEEPQITPEGNTITLLTSKIPLRDSRGEISGILGVYLDITERRQAEEALKARDEQLRQSQKMEAVGQLAGGIAHDFNNLLTAILGYSDLILASGSSTVDEVRPDLEEIKHAGERARALTQQILAFSRRQALRPTAVSLNQVLAEMEPFLRRTLGEHMDLVSLQHPALGQVEVDVHQFEQVVLNLAVNARDAMASGGRLTLETGNVDLDAEYCLAHPQVEPGSYVMLAVSDTGTGMDGATLARAFEPFFTTKAPGEGTGLGLATVYGIVKQSNGSISIYSEPGKGTTFKIYLPRAETPARAEGVLPISAPLSLRGDETILLVEDEVALRKLASRILSELGYVVLSAGTAAEALKVLAEASHEPDLLLTDLVLPGGTQGKDLALELLSTRPGLPVLFMSGYTRNAIVHAGRLDEGVNFLEKPFTPEALARMVRTVLDQARGSG